LGWRAGGEMAGGSAGVERLSEGDNGGEERLQ
jgi:hypothetical protein